MDTKVFSSTCEEHQNTKAAGINTMNEEPSAAFFLGQLNFYRFQTVSDTQFQQVLSAVQVCLSAETCAAMKKKASVLTTHSKNSYPVPI